MTDVQDTPDLPSARDVDERITRAWSLVGKDHHAALVLSREALAYARALRDEGRVAQGHLHVGIFSMLLTDHDAATSGLEAALAAFRRVGDRDGEARALVHLATTYQEQGRAHDALRSGFAGLAAARELGNTRVEGAALKNLGIIHEALCDDTGAIELYTQSLQLRDHDPAARTECLVSMGKALQRLERYEEALAHQRAAHASARAAGDARRECVALIHIGGALVQLGRAEEAAGAFDEALGLALAARERRSEVRARHGLGRTARALGDAPAAARYLEAALRAAREAKDTWGEVRAQLDLAELSIDGARHAEALELLRSALHAARAAGLRMEERDIHALLVRAHESRGAHREALDAYRAYHELERAVLNDTQARRAQALLLRQEVEQARRAAEVERALNEELQRRNEALARLDEERQGLLDRVMQQAREDALTGLANRRFLTERLVHEFNLAMRYAQPMTVVLADVDHFKRVNDTFSHAVGDVVLARIADILRENCRDVDTVARFGGEEFALILPGTGAQGAGILCERLRQLVQDAPWSEVAPGLSVTLSLGISDIERDDTDEAEQLLKLADDRLSRAKTQGRNRVVS